MAKDLGNPSKGKLHGQSAHMQVLDIDSGRENLLAKGLGKVMASESSFPSLTLGFSLKRKENSNPFKVRSDLEDQS